jgi:hypothetical protein
MARHIGDIVSALTWDRQYCQRDPKENSKYTGGKIIFLTHQQRIQGALSQREIMPFGHQEKVA